MYSYPKTLTWIALKWTKPRGRWNISKGFAWTLLDRPVNDFPSTGQTSVWRKPRLLHIEGVSEDRISTLTQLYQPLTFPPARPFTSSDCRSSQNCSPAVPKITPTLPCFVLVAVWFPTQAHPDRSTLQNLKIEKMKRNDTQKRITKMLLYIRLIFLACLCAFSLSWAFLLTERAMVWNYFLILAWL